MEINRKQVLVTTPKTPLKMEGEGISLDASGRFYWAAEAYRYLDSEMNKDVVSLDFSTNHVSDLSVGILASFLKDPTYSLREINLTQCRLTEKVSIELLAAIGESKIEYLTLDRNLLTIPCCEALGNAINQNKNIKYLSIQGCDIMKNGFEYICKAIATAPNLTVLRVDNNSTFDDGAKFLAHALQTSNISSLSVSDNQIWKEGMTELLSSISSAKKMVELDLSYNILDLNELASAIYNLPMLKALNISGCKVQENQVPLFLKAIKSTNIEMIMINGLSYNILPIAWPKVKDFVWQDKEKFLLLLDLIRNSPRLVDLRVGFLETEQLSNVITAIDEEMHKENFNKKFSLSMIDFGRTENCWVATFPYFELQLPCNVFKWASKLMTANSAKDITTFIRAARFEGTPVTKIDLSGCFMTNEVLGQLFAGLQNTGIDEINISGNKFDDGAAPAITVFLSESSPNTLIIENALFTDEGLAAIFKFLAANDGKYNPTNLSISYKGDAQNENIIHQCFVELADVLARDSKLQHLTIRGPITSQDAAKIIEPLSNNESLLSLNLLGEIPERYQETTPRIDPLISDNFASMARNLHTVLLNPESRCRLSEFNFPLFSQTFLYNDRVLDFWSEVETKLDENKSL